MIAKPAELHRAEFLAGVGERFGVLPTEVAKADGELLRILSIEAMGRKDD